VGQKAGRAVLNALLGIRAVAAAAAAQCVQGAEAEQAVELLLIAHLVAGEIFTLSVLIKAIGVFHRYTSQ
jgi:hypothetical protein